MARAHGPGNAILFTVVEALSRCRITGLYEFCRVA